MEEVYYTPERIEYWLRRWQALDTAVHLSCAVENMGERNGSGRRGNGGLDTDLFCVWCDLSKAIDQLPLLERSIITGLYIECQTWDEVRAKQQIRKERVGLLKKSGIQLMSETLGGTTK